jgi:hypothetical protein
MIVRESVAYAYNLPVSVYYAADPFSQGRKLIAELEAAEKRLFIYFREHEGFGRSRAAANADRWPISSQQTHAPPKCKQPEPQLAQQPAQLSQFGLRLPRRTNHCIFTS